MILGEVIKKYRDEHGNMSMSEFAKLSGLSKPYVSMLENNKNSSNGKPIVPSITTFKKVAEVIGIPFDDLMRMMGDEQEVSLVGSHPAASALPKLTVKDERQIANDLEDMLHSLKGAAAMGDPKSTEDAEMLKASLETAMRLSKRIAKQKYTPRKYRKDD